MVTKEQFIIGILTYADQEIMPHLPTIGKWGMGTMMVLAESRTESIIDSLVNNPLAKSLGVVNDDGLIDCDELAKALCSSAHKYGKVQMVIPVIGTLTFSEEDVLVVKRYITGE